MANKWKDLGLRLDDLFSVKVDSLHADTENADLEDAFKEFGEVMDVYIPGGGKGYSGNKGYAFVRFAKQEEADDAVKAKVMNIRDTDVDVSLAERNKPKGGKKGKGKDRWDDWGGGKGFGKRDRYDDYDRGYDRGGRGRDRSRGRDRGGRDDSRPRGRRDDSRRRR